MVERRPKRRARNNSGPEELIDWFLWRPCTGINGLLPPLSTWGELNDGTYSLAHVEEMNQVIDAVIEKHNAI